MLDLLALAAPLLASAVLPAPQNCPKIQANLIDWAVQPDADTEYAVVSADGRYLAWSTAATNVFSSLDGHSDVFVSDLVAGGVVLASVAFSGGSGDLESLAPSLSASGRQVVFYSEATDLLAAPQPSGGIYLRDLDGSATQRIDVTPGGDAPDAAASPWAALSPCGGFVAFASAATDLVPGLTGLAPGRTQVYLRDVQAGVTELVSGVASAAGNGESLRPTVTSGGLFVLFETDAANLDPSDTNGVRDMYLLDRSAGSLERVSLDGTGAQGTQPARGGQLTPDASRVVFATASAFDPAAPAGVEQIYVRDRSAATTTLASLESMGPADADCHSASISQDGRLVVFTSSADNLNPTPNGLDDVFERDLVSGALRLVSRRDSGLVSSSNASWTSPWGPAHTADGLRRVFLTDVKGMNALFDPNGFTDVYLDACDLARACPAVQINLTESGGQPSTETFEVSVSENGAYVAWTTTSANVVSVPAGDSRKDVFVSHLATGAVEQASVAFGAGDSNGACFEATLSASGRIVAFSSQATNLLATPQSMWGVYVRDLDAGTTERIDVTPAGGEPDGIGSQPWISACGRYVAFKSGATDIVPGVPGLGGGPNQTQIFLRDRSAGTTALISVSPGGVAGDKESAAPFVTPGGRFVAFETDAENLDPGDTNGVGDIYLCDRAQGTLEQVSLGTGGVQGQRSWAGEVTADGRFVSFLNAFPFDPTAPAGITQLYRRDRVTDTTVLVSVGAGGASTSSLSRYSMSGDGSKFVFDTRAANLQLGLWSGNAKVFLKDLATGALTLLSLNADGTLSMPNSEVSPWGAAFSGDGLSTAFLSRGSGITPDPDPNGQVDVFMDRCPAGGGATYCTAEVNSLGCTPAIGASGTPSASGASAFSVTCDQVVSQRLGLFYYSVVGPSALPFQGGLRCVASPVRRTPLTSSGGSATPDCTGVLSIDFAAWIAGGADPALVSGQRVWGQWWSRDSGSSFATNLSDAIAFDIAP